jgi:23S rRNA pseudouridine1911/1915/1917 synthase
VAETPKKQASEASQSGTVGPDLDKSALDAAVRTLFGLSWGRARDLVKRGKIAVDGKTVTSGTVWVKAGQVIALDLGAKKKREDELPPNAIVFVDGHVVVVEKPSGISTVPFDPDGMGASIAKGRSREPGAEVTLDQRVRSTLARRFKAPGPPPEIGIVHRLDKETTGLIVFTRSWQAKKELTQAFRAHQVHRRYLALVHGSPKKDKLTIESNFVDDRGDGLRGSVERRRGRKHAIGNEKTQHAVTHIEVIERFDADKKGGGLGQDCALVACRLETGRTHQIRIHLAEEGHPLIGERVYIRDFGRSPIPAPRIMLHAAELGFDHPATGEAMQWSSELPKDMQEMIAFVNAVSA